MDLSVRSRRLSSRKNSCNVKSMCSGQLSRKPIRSSLVKSLGSGTLGTKLNLTSGSFSQDPRQDLTVSLALTASTTRERSLSTGSTASANSFVCLDSNQSHFREDEDPYLSRRRRRPKSEPTIPQFGLGESFDDFVTCCTSPEKWTPPVSPGRSTSLISASFPKVLQVPAKLLFGRDDASVANSSAHSVSSRQVEATHKAKKEQAHWNSIVTTRTISLGSLHRETAEAWMQLGHAHIKLNDCHDAMTSFKSACKIFKVLEGPTHLSVGRALDSFGLAALRLAKSSAGGGSSSLSKQAKRALDEAFAIRFHHLGVWHVDTVETFNKIASVYLHVGNLQEAAKAYQEVYLVRKAIFGNAHPSVAISAHSLANVHLKLSQPEESFGYYNTALDIYTQMGLSNTHPTVARLLKDRTRLERICMTAVRS